MQMQPFLEPAQFRFRSIRSNYHLLGRKLEAKAGSNRDFFAKFKIVLQFAVVVGHTLPRMAQPKMDEILGHAISSKMRNAETAKSVTAALRLIDVF